MQFIKEAIYRNKLIEKALKEQMKWHLIPTQYLKTLRNTARNPVGSKKFEKEKKNCKLIIIQKSWQGHRLR